MNCPCCHHPLLRHIDRRGLYWYCPDCRQEMPSLECRDRPAKPKQYWIYIPLHPSQQKIA